MAEFELGKRIKKALATRIAHDQQDVHFSKCSGQESTPFYFTVSVPNVEFNLNSLKWQIDNVKNAFLDRPCLFEECAAVPNLTVYKTHDVPMFVKHTTFPLCLPAKGDSSSKVSSGTVLVYKNKEKNRTKV